MKYDPEKMLKVHMNGRRAFIMISLIILAAGLITTFLAWQTYVDKSTDKATEDFIKLTERSQASIINRFDDYEDIARGISAYLGLTDTVTKDQWIWYVEALRLDERYSGTLSVGTVSVYNQSSLDTSVVSIPSTKNDLIAPIDLSYVNNNSFDLKTFDLYSVNGLQDSIDESLKSKSATLSGVIAKKTRGNPFKEDIVYLFHPVENTEEQKELVFVAISPKALIENSMDNNVAIDVVIADQEQILYGSENKTSTINRHQEFKTAVEVINKKWDFNFYSEAPMQSASGNMVGAIILLVGTILSTLVASFLLYVNINRHRLLEEAKAHELASAKSDLVALTSHQLRTPATAVKQYIGMVLQGYAGEVANIEQLDFLERAFQSNERQIEIINHLLIVAKADAQQLKLDKKRISLNKTVANIVDEVQQSIHEKQHKIVIESKKNIHIRADPEYVSIIFENLLTNAIKYSPQRSTIKVTLQSTKKMATISVTDKGVGIADKDIHKLFVKFSRIDNSLSAEAGGSGIGLYLSKKLAELHNGDITVKSNEKSGSTFTITLPL